MKGGWVGARGFWGRRGLGSRRRLGGPRRRHSGAAVPPKSNAPGWQMQAPRQTGTARESHWLRPKDAGQGADPVWHRRRRARADGPLPRARRSQDAESKQGGNRAEHHGHASARRPQRRVSAREAAGSPGPITLTGPAPAPTMVAPPGASRRWQLTSPVAWCVPQWDMGGPSPSTNRLHAPQSKV